MGQRLDSAPAAWTSAEKELSWATVAVRRAVQQHRAAEHQFQQATHEHQRIQAENAPEVPPSVRELTRCVHEPVYWEDAQALGRARPKGTKPECLQQRRGAMRSALDAADVEEEETSDD